MLLCNVSYTSEQIKWTFEKFKHRSLWFSVGFASSALQETHSEWGNHTNLGV